jgi:electron transport complex protein RnfB
VQRNAEVSDVTVGIQDALPQTQCTRCGWPDCAAYAGAIAAGQAAINRCPPGGAQGIARLAAITGQGVQPLDSACGAEGPRGVAVIDEAWCIGCTLCIKACPVDCILGANTRMHTVVETECTGCELCVPACPVDCIEMEAVTGAKTGWAAWSQNQADAARTRYTFVTARRQREAQEHEQRLLAKAHHKLAHLPELTKNAEGAELARKRAVIEAALTRAREKAGRRGMAK